jgi:glucose-1-phosphate thymidylyltransferase
MKVILPVAGKGTRLLPITRHTPKPLIRVAGRPVLDYVMDRLDGLDVEELIFITGHLKEQIESFVKDRYTIPSRFVEQKVQDGTAGAVALGRDYIDGPVLIVFVDTVFDADISIVNSSTADGIIWAKEVEDYQRFGVIVTDEDGYMERIVEKPSEPISKLANIGLYFIRDWKTLYEGIDHTLASPKNKGEWYLTDAFQYMVDRGKKLFTASVDGWYDCGKVETVLETNRYLLDHGAAAVDVMLDGSSIADPVRVETGATVVKSTIGPNVVVEQGATVDNCTLRDTIVGRGSVLRNCTIVHSLIGDNVTLENRDLDNMVAAIDEVAPAP